ncbi:MAG: hypothetical protein Ct9H300mP5_5310 [Candidatus Pelagibacterales bacterium]|nr:MAG: hypothetical protein Ct9H300mP5_5310 [Pelagibacterales bacterium]
MYQERALKPECIWLKLPQYLEHFQFIISSRKDCLGGNNELVEAKFKGMFVTAYLVNLNRYQELLLLMLA